MFCSSKVYFHCLSMQRFVSKRSSSSVDLDSSSRRRRAGRAGRHRPVCWSELATSQTAAVGGTLQLAAAVGTVLFRSTSSTTMSSRMVSAYSGRAGGNPGDTIDPRPLTHEEIAHVSTPCAASGHPSHCTRRRRAQRQRGKAPQDPRRPHRARLVPRHVHLPVEDRTAMGM